jgi:hypothetical protein
MKAKYFIGILSALLLAGIPVKAQDTDDVYLDENGPVLKLNCYFYKKY